MPSVGEIIVVCMLLLFIFFAGVYSGITHMQKESIKKGYAQYHSVTGEWEWK